MNIFDQVATKACCFYIHTTYNSNIEPNYLVNEYSRGTDGHFMSATWHGEDVDKFYKFIIYPDPTEQDNPEAPVRYRMSVLGYDQHVLDFLDRLTLQLPSDKNTQLFNFVETAPSILDPEEEHHWYNIKGLERNQYVWIEPIAWVHPISGTGDSVQQEHMKFRFEVCDEKSPDQSKLKSLDEKEPSRSRYPNDNDEIAFKEYGKKHVSTEAIPAAYVTDRRIPRKINQFQLSPYYYLKLETVWVRGLIPNITVGPGETKTYSDTLTTAFKSDHLESVEKTVGYTLDASLEGKIAQETKVGIGEGGEEGESKLTRSGTLKLSAQYKNQTRTIKKDQTSTSTEIKHQVDKSYASSGAGYRVVFWTPVDRYHLFNSRGETVGKWEHVDIENSEEQRIAMEEPSTT